MSLLVDFDWVSMISRRHLAVKKRFSKVSWDSQAEWDDKKFKNEFCN